MWHHWQITYVPFELWCWRRLLRVPWTARKSKQSILKNNQSWIFTGKTDAEAEAPIICPPDRNNWLIWKYPDVRKDWRQKEKWKTEWDGWMASPRRWTWAWVSSESWWCWEAWHAAIHGVAKRWTPLKGLNWTEQMRTKRLINLIAASWWLAAHNNTLLKYL